MRQISFLLLFTLALPALALEQKLSLSYSSEDAGVSGISMKSQGLRPTRNQRQSMDYFLESENGWEGGVRAIAFQHDYSTTFYRDAQGVEWTFGDRGRNETQVGTSLGYRHGLWHGLAGYSQTTSSESLFKTRRALVSNDWNFEKLGTKVVFTWTHQEVDQPEAYYLDTSFMLRPRPLQVTAQQAMWSVEQIFNSRTKGKFSFAELWRPKERPQSYELGAQLAYSWSSRLFSTVDLRRAWDERGDPLKDERGYFENRSGSVAVTYEPIYDLLVSGSYGYALEFEELPSSKVEAGTAQYGVGVAYAHFPWELGVQGATTQSQVRGNGYFAQGDMKWSF